MNKLEFMLEIRVLQKCSKIKYFNIHKIKNNEIEFLLEKYNENMILI